MSRVNAVRANTLPLARVQPQREPRGAAPARAPGGVLPRRQGKNAVCFSYPQTMKCILLLYYSGILCVIQPPPMTVSPS